MCDVVDEALAAWIRRWFPSSSSIRDLARTVSRRGEDHHLWLSEHDAPFALAEQLVERLRRVGLDGDTFHRLGRRAKASGVGLEGIAELCSLAAAAGFDVELWTEADDGVGDSEALPRWPAALGWTGAPVLLIVGWGLLVAWQRTVLFGLPLAAMHGPLSWPGTGAAGMLDLVLAAAAAPWNWSGSESGAVALLAWLGGSGLALGLWSRRAARPTAVRWVAVAMLGWAAAQASAAALFLGPIPPSGGSCAHGSSWWEMACIAWHNGTRQDLLAQLSGASVWIAAGAAAWAAPAQHGQGTSSRAPAWVAMAVMLGTVTLVLPRALILAEPRTTAVEDLGLTPPP